MKKKESIAAESDQSAVVRQRSASQQSFVSVSVQKNSRIQLAEKAKELQGRNQSKLEVLKPYDSISSIT